MNGIMGLVEMRPRIQQEGKDHPYASCPADLEKVSQLVSLDTCAAMTVFYKFHAAWQGLLNNGLIQIEKCCLDGVVCFKEQR